MRYGSNGRLLPLSLDGNYSDRIVNNHCTVLCADDEGTSIAGTLHRDSATLHRDRARGREGGRVGEWEIKGGEATNHLKLIKASRQHKKNLVGGGGEKCWNDDRER